MKELKVGDEVVIYDNGMPITGFVTAIVHRTYEIATITGRIHHREAKFIFNDKHTTHKAKLNYSGNAI